MTILIAFGIGVGIGVLTVAAWMFTVLVVSQRRCERRGGYLDLTGTHIEGRTASADPYDAELSGGLTSRPPTHLRVVKGEKE